MPLIAAIHFIDILWEDAQVAEWERVGGGEREAGIGVRKGCVGEEVMGGLKLRVACCRGLV